jgi:hypothetical protein
MVGLKWLCFGVFGVFCSVLIRNFLCTILCYVWVHFGAIGVRDPRTLENTGKVSVSGGQIGGKCPSVADTYL